MTATQWGKRTTQDPHPYSDYYLCQLYAGDWYTCPFTEHQWNGKPHLPAKYDRVFETREAAQANLDEARREYLAAMPAPAYRTGDGRRHDTIEAAKAHANAVFLRRGIVLAINAA